MSPVSFLELGTRFTYHAPKEDQPEKYKRIREAAKMLAYEIDKSCPAGTLTWTQSRRCAENSAEND
jgi:hypothetical protein